MFARMLMLSLLLFAVAPVAPPPETGDVAAAPTRLLAPADSVGDRPGPPAPAGAPEGEVPQLPDGYELVRLWPDEDIVSVPVINNRGDVIWSVNYPPFVGDVYLYSNGMTRRLTDDSAYELRPWINDNGTAVWMRGPDWNPPFEIITYNGESASVLGGAPGVTSEVIIGNGGHIVWDHETDPGSYTHVELWRWNGSFTRIADDTLANSGAAVNARGDLAWTAYDFSQSPWISQIMLCASGTVVQLTSKDEPRGSVGINDGTVVVWAELGLARGIALWDGQGVTMPVVGEASAPRTNSHGALFYGLWNDELRIWEGRLRVDGVDRLVTPRDRSFATGTLNGRDEAAWRGRDPSSNAYGIFALRRIAPRGDFDHDCRVDFRDYQGLQLCFTGPDTGPSGGLLGDCTRGDFDDDGDIDMEDMQAFENAFTGPGIVVGDCTP